MKPPGRRWRRPFSPLRQWAQVPPLAVQAACRQIFQQWGLPGALRVDNGAPWGSWNDLPPALALWWLGLGITVVWNRPRHPQANGVVERWQGLLEAWGEPGQCADRAAWEARLGWVVQVQREQYPAIDGASRLAAYPGLAERGRPYDLAQEAAQWQLSRVTAYLAQGLWPRRVSRVGQISLYNRAYGVGRAYAGQSVWVRFDAVTHAWVVQDEAGRAVVRHPAQQMTTERIVGLTVSEGERHNHVTHPEV